MKSLPEPVPHEDGLLAEHGEVIQSLFEAFRALAEESAKKNKRIERLERESAELKQFVFMNVIEGLNQVKGRVVKFDKIDAIVHDIDSVKASVADFAHLQQGRSFGNHPIGDGVDQLNTSLKSISSAIEGVARQRNEDVDAINSSLERLENRLANIVQQPLSGGPAEKDSSVLDRVVRDLEGVRLDLIPDLESDWAAKWMSLSGRIAAVDENVGKMRTECLSGSERTGIRESKLMQLTGSAEGTKRMCERIELGQLEVEKIVRKLESDMTFLFEEIKRIDSEHASVFSLEAKVELGRAECKSNFERVQRVGKQDLEAVRIKVERLAILKDELERMKPLLENRSLRFPDSVPPLMKTLTIDHAASPLSESSLLSLVDEGIATAGAVRISDDIFISVPTGGAETGVLRSDGATRLIWRIDNMAAVVREPTRWPNIFVSPQFEQNPGLVGRLKLFPTGSDQSRIEGNCSMYLRCLPGVVVRFAIELGGEVIETFECEYEKQRDKGKHDFVKLNEYIAPDGSLTIGLEIRSIRLIS